MPWENVGEHDHEFLEIVIFLRGRTRHVTRRGRDEVGPGDVLVLRPGEAHGYEGFRNLRLANVHVDPAFLLEVAGELRGDPVFQAWFQVRPQLAGAEPDKQRPTRLGLSAPGLVEAERLVLRLVEELKTNRPGRMLLARALMLELIVLLVREGEAQGGVIDEKIRRLAEACAHVERHFREPLRLGDLASKAGMSVNGFLRVFRRLHGISPIAYAQRLRLSHARKLLREGGLSVTEVALESGFGDSNYFSRCYRKGYGEAPTATRRRG